MSKPTPERIAAALALAEAAEVYERKVADIEMPNEPESKAFAETLSAYRATAPKLRTRAEVDAEIVGEARLWFSSHADSANYASGYEALSRLCAEPTAEAEPAACICGDRTFGTLQVCPHRDKKGRHL